MTKSWLKSAVFIASCTALGGAMLWGLSTADVGRAEEAHGGHAHGIASTAQGEVAPIIFGDLEIQAPVIRETPPGARAAAGFLTITNTGDADERLIAISVDFAPRSELHDMVIEDDVMRMREVEDGFLIPAGGSLALDPTAPGLHLMFIDLEERMVAGEARAVTLVFENAGETSVTFTVEKMGPGHGGGHVGAHGGHGGAHGGHGDAHGGHGGAHGD